MSYAGRRVAGPPDTPTLRPLFLLVGLLIAFRPWTMLLNTLVSAFMIPVTAPNPLRTRCSIPTVVSLEVDLLFSSPLRSPDSSIPCQDVGGSAQLFAMYPTIQSSSL